MFHCLGSVTQNQETFPQCSEAAGVGAAAKTKPCGSSGAALPTAPAAELKDARGTFWYEQYRFVLTLNVLCCIFVFNSFNAKDVFFMILRFQVRLYVF